MLPAQKQHCVSTVCYRTLHFRTVCTCRCGSRHTSLQSDMLLLPMLGNWRWGALQWQNSYEVSWKSVNCFRIWNGTRKDIIMMSYAHVSSWLKRINRFKSEIQVNTNWKLIFYFTRAFSTNTGLLLLVRQIAVYYANHTKPTYTCTVRERWVFQRQVYVYYTVVTSALWRVLNHAMCDRLTQNEQDAALSGQITKNWNCNAGT